VEESVQNKCLPKIHFSNSEGQNRPSQLSYNIKKIALEICSIYSVNLNSTRE
jgi:hypothetical protein